MLSVEFFADEFSAHDSALDIAHQIEVLALVRRLSKERGSGVVVVLHDINMAGRFCDELIALKDGGMPISFAH